MAITRAALMCALDIRENCQSEMPTFRKKKKEDLSVSVMPTPTTLAPTSAAALPAAPAGQGSLPMNPASKVHKERLELHIGIGAGQVWR